MEIIKLASDNQNEQMNSKGLTDAEIWNSFKKGEEWAISCIYAEYAEKLYRYGLKFTPEIAVIEDTLQDLFAELIKNRKRIGNTDNILFYLLKSFKRKLLRKIQTQKRFVSDEELQDYHFDVSWSIEHELILEEVSEQKSKMLLKALNELTPRQKEAIYLRFTKELNYSEVAGLMDISVEACRNLISKAISTLKKWISEKGQGPAVFFALVFQ
jgi:RNA polymerase sigma factor (sigma-70 family)